MTISSYYPQNLAVLTVTSYRNEGSHYNNIHTLAKVLSISDKDSFDYLEKFGRFACAYCSSLWMIDYFLFGDHYSSSGHPYLSNAWINGYYNVKDKLVKSDFTIFFSDIVKQYLPKHKVVRNSDRKGFHIEKWVYKKQVHYMVFRDKTLIYDPLLTSYTSRKGSFQESIHFKAR